MMASMIPSMSFFVIQTRTTIMHCSSRLVLRIRRSYKRVRGTGTLLGTKSATAPSAGDTWKFKVIGNELIAYVDKAGGTNFTEV